MIFPEIKEKIRELFQNSDKKITAITGLSKNAGKTSFLNWLIKILPQQCYGIITTGRDGEDFDLLSGYKKPKVLIPENTFFSTFSYVIKAHSPYLKVICKLPYRSAGKELWLVKSTSEIFSEVVGPVSVKEQIELANLILKYGADHVFVDGSLDRKSILLSPETDQFFLVVSPEYKKMDELLLELKKIVELSKIPLKFQEKQFDNITIGTNNNFIKLDFNSLFGNEKKLVEIISDYPKIKWLFIPGAITDNSWGIIKPVLVKKSIELILKNTFNLHLNLINYELLKNNVELFAQHRPTLQGIAVNSFSVNDNHWDCDIFRSRIRTEFQHLPVIDIREI